MLVPPVLHLNKPSTRSQAKLDKDAGSVAC